ncbi:MAG: GNAT family N-acetyltransferase, partial [Dehalococcoidia bacterium]
MSVTIRTAERDDREACLELISALTERPSEEAWGPVFDQLLTGERGAIVVAEEDGTVLGLATVSYNLAIRYAGEYCQLEELIVDPAARGKNVGALLMEAVVANAKRRGCAEMGLYLVERTEGNRPFYEKFGFVYVGSE